MDGFRPVDEFKAQMDAWIRRFRQTKAAEGQTVLIPGDPERFAAAERAVSGIPVPAKVVEDMDDIARATGIAY